MIKRINEQTQALFNLLTLTYYESDSEYSTSKQMIGKENWEWLDPQYFSQSWLHLDVNDNEKKTREISEAWESNIIIIY